MATKDNTEKNKRGLSRRDFFKVTAAAGAAGGFTSALDWSVVGPAEKALAADPSTITTCPFCSVGCNMVVDVTGGAVTDVYGDTTCPINRGALCSKGSAAIQLVTNEKRIGVPENTTGITGPVKRVGGSGQPQTWTSISWDDALTEIATAMVAARSASGTWMDGSTTPANVSGHAEGVAFLGCSHATNEENWLYRKLIANFGTTNVDHQARI